MSADGNWKVTINTPMGARSMEMSIATAGATFTGKVKGEMGELDVDGTVDGNKLAWSTNLTQPMPIKLEFDVTVDGDKMGGTVKLGPFGNQSMSGERI